MRVRLAFLLAPLAVIALATAAHAVELTGKLTQGGLVKGQVPKGAVVTLDGGAVPLSADGQFALGFDRDAGPEMELVVKMPDGAIERQTLQIAPRTFNVQRIDGLPPKYVTPPPETLARIKRERETKNAARRQITAETGFAEDFIWPTTGRISGVYGSQRFYNGQPRSPHWGVDIAAPTGTVVKAPAGGIVTLAEPDMYFEGGLIFLDHGVGVVSAFLHLSEVDVKVGDKVGQGDPIGKVGAGGRASGPHLDWRMYWLKQHIDTELLVPPMPASE